MRIRYYLFALSIIILGIFSGCALMGKRLDMSGLKDMNESVLLEVEACSESEVVTIFSQKNYFTSFSKEIDNDFKIRNETRWGLKPVNGKRIQSFHLAQKSKYFNDNTTFYFYKTEDWDGEKAILWAPGFGVSDFAFHFIKKIFYEELKQGYALLVYIPPYHLDRLKEGKKTGQGMITGNVLVNLNTLHALSEELNVGYRYLQDIGVKKIGAWAGSIGASALSILSITHEFDHICLMIPILDWNTLIFNPIFKEVRGKLTNSFCNENMLREAYSLVSPKSYQMNISPERVLIQYAEYDQLTPSETTIDYANKRNIHNVTKYPESHATILLNSAVYKDYAVFLDNMHSKDK